MRGRERIMSVSAATTTEAEVIPFPAAPARASNRMTVRDRIEALRWSDTAASLGYTRVLLDTSDHEGDLALGDFMLVYRQAANWAAWGVGCVADGFILWCPQTGATIARFKTLGAALERIQALS
jgi:hypothetical protein